MAELKRIFDILTAAEENFNKEVSLSVKRNNRWENFSTNDYRKNVDK